MRADRARRRTTIGVGTTLLVLVLLLLSLEALTVLQTRRAADSPFVRCVSPLASWGGLDSNPAKRGVAQMLVGSAENSSLYWEEQVGYLEYNVEGAEEWNRGYTGGIIGFTSKTSSMLEVVKRYVAARPSDNPLAPFLPALEAVNGTSSTAGLGREYEQAWQEAAEDPLFLQTQLEVTEDWYLSPALERAEADRLGPFGQFAYYDAMVQHGDSGFTTIHAAALRAASPPVQGGDEQQWLQAFLDAREDFMTREVSTITATRVTTSQQGLLHAGELQLRAPLAWDIYGDHFRIEVAPFCSRG